MKPLLVSSGEPAGIGPDLCLALADFEFPIVILGDKKLLTQRAQQLKKQVILHDYQPQKPMAIKKGQLTVLSIPCPEEVEPGKLEVKNSAYVMEMLRLAASQCLEGEFAALITAPVHKAIISEAGFIFTGHTEFFANFYAVDPVVMMLACATMKVALVTTHLPLREVAKAISAELISKVIKQLHISLQQDFGIKSPCIYVAGLNPHAGEGGYLGHEEIDIIKPTLNSLKKEGYDVSGPFPADTLFTAHYLKQCDVFVTMYHDQGLPVIKYAAFDSAVNVTLGLPIIRTSVDHGTALELAGTGLADPGSLVAAVNMAHAMAKTRESIDDHFKPHCRH
jgi:4-hydroxythreonine-4-phosphate dehydrogenase